MNKDYKTIHGMQPPAISKWWTAVFIALLFCLIGVNANAQTQAHNITISIGNGNGNVTADKSTAQKGDTVTLKVAPDQGYFLSILVANRGRVRLSDYTWYDGTNTITFEMPDNDVNVIAEFDKAVDNPELYFVRMPLNGTKKVTIPDGLESFFAIYDGRDIDDDNIDKIDGALEITGPDGYAFSINGAFYNNETNEVKLYDGLTTDSKVLIENQNDKKPYEVDSIYSSGKNVLLKYQADSFDNWFQFALNFKLSEPMDNKGTADNPFIINNATEYLEFADKVNHGFTNACAKLAANISIGMNDTNGLIGTEENPYSGTFDGQGHNLQFEYDGTSTEEDAKTEENVAPFSCVSGATIKNLIITATVISDSKTEAGVVAKVANSDAVTTLERCTLTSILVSTETTEDIGGFVANAQGPLAIKDCFFYGGVLEYPGTNQNNSAALVANASAPTTVDNCFVTTAEFNGASFSKINPVSSSLDNITVTNCYSDTTFLAQDGVKVASSEDVKSGKLLVALQNERTDAPYWMQVPKLDMLPIMTYSEVLISSLEGYEFIYYNVDKGSMYCNYIQLAQDSLAMPAIDFLTDTVINERTLYAGLNTVCLPYNIDLTAQGCKAYILDNVNEESNTITFREVSGPILAAEPYIVDCPNDGISLNASDVTFRGSREPQPVSATVGRMDVSMRGTYDKIGNDSLAFLNAYILQDDSLWHPVAEGNNAYLNPTRAFITVGRVYMAKPFSMVLGDEETTGISNIKTVDIDGTVKYYDLNGRYIGTSLDGARRGIYVTSDGKKIKK